MSAATAQAPLKTTKNTRRVPRFPLSVPADVTVLRSGIPFSIPGRSVSIGERGVGVVLAGELHPGDSVGIEFRLPDAGGPFRLKAVVRYQALLHCGLEFVNLTSEQQTLIEHWTRKKSATNPPPVITASVPFIDAPDLKGRTTTFGRSLLIVLAGTLLLGGCVRLVALAPCMERTGIADSRKQAPHPTSPDHGTGGGNGRTGNPQD